MTLKTTDNIKYYECRSCRNEWRLDEDFQLDTMQCKGCQDWDDTKEQRDKEWEERKKALDSYDDFEYVPGDPYW